MQGANLYAPDDFEEKVNALVARRIEGEPIAYIIGEWEFYGLPVKVNQNVLIPRTDTEVLVDAALTVLKKKPDSRVLDLCSGSGCVGIALAANVPSCRVIMVDNSAKALSVCRENILLNGLTRAITCVQADACEPPPMLLGRFDMIICNPPYISTEELAKLDASVREYEPASALDGGEDGLDFYREIASKWGVALKENGQLLFECGAGQAEEVKNIMLVNGFGDIKIFKDTLDIDRVVMGTLAG